MAKIFILGSLAESLINFRGPLLKAWVNNGNQVIACAPMASPTIKRQLKSWGIKYEDVTIHRTGMNVFKDLVSLISLFVTVKRNKPDIFFGYTVKAVLYGSLAAKIAGCSRVYSMITGLGSLLIDPKGSFLIPTLIHLLYRICLKMNTKVIFQNSDDQDYFIRNKLLVNRQQAVIVNGSGVDLNYYRVSALPQNISFVMIGRLIRDKGVCEYVDAARLIQKKHPHIRFFLVGWIDDNPSSISEGELNGWINNGYIEYLGRVDDVRPILDKSSVFVLPSYREGIPRTVLEAMSMGRPIITTDVPGCKETVENNVNGFIVPHKNSNALAKAMEKFILHPDFIHKMGVASRTIAIEKYDVNKINSEILAHMKLC